MLALLQSARRENDGTRAEIALLSARSERRIATYCYAPPARRSGPFMQHAIPAKVHGSHANTHQYNHTICIHTMHDQKLPVEPYSSPTPPKTYAMKNKRKGMKAT